VKGIELNRKSGIPLYVQIREIIRKELDRMLDGEPVSTEADIERRFGVSRITVRRALEDLTSEGLLVRRPGKGTFVRKPKYTHELNAITSWTEQIRAAGYEPSTEHIATEAIAPPEHVAGALQLAEGRVVLLKRLRLADAEPISLMVHYLPEKLVPGLAESGLHGESLYESLEERYGLIPAVATDTVQTREATMEEAGLLRTRPGEPMLFVTRVSYLEDGSPLEFVTVASRGDRYRYRVSLSGRVPSFGPAMQNAVLDGRNG
jgi:GntR family transcriptional regulator